MDRERVIENQTVLVRDGRIAEIGPESKIKVGRWLPEGEIQSMLDRIAASQQ
jgi:imidazolonepropionase-like amidohydrolase